MVPYDVFCFEPTLTARAPLAGVKVSVHGTTQSTVTDVNGKATLTLSTGTHRLTFEKKGFYKFSVEVETGGLAINPNKFTLLK